MRDGDAQSAGEIVDFGLDLREPWRVSSDPMLVERMLDEFRHHLRMPVGCVLPLVGGIQSLQRIQPSRFQQPITLRTGF